VKALWLVPALLLIGSVSVQGSVAAGSTTADPRQQLDAFCATHASDCAQLKALHEAAHQACADGQAQTAACRQARDSVHAQMQTLESLGVPRPARPPGPPPGEGEQPPPPEDGMPPPR
jgi:hypothetical protein